MSRNLLLLSGRIAVYIWHNEIFGTLSPEITWKGDSMGKQNACSRSWLLLDVFSKVMQKWDELTKQLVSFQARMQENTERIKKFGDLKS